MRAYLETTDWPIEYTIPASVYLLDSDWMHAFQPGGQGPIKWFKKPIRIDRRGRRFKEVDAAIVGESREAEIRTITVVGSKGDVYQVDPDAATCTCPGYTFRGACRHVKELAKN